MLSNQQMDQLTGAAVDPAMLAMTMISVFIVT
jgi:hypothetical protein